MKYSAACLDPHIFGPWFSEESWGAWRVVDKALFGEPLNADELAIFRELTGRDEAPAEPVSEAWFIIGRRGGKDVKAASIAAYLATIGDEIHGYRQYLKPGERGVVQLLAVDRDQAKLCLGYLKAMFEQPMLARLVSKHTADGIDLTNGLGIEITTNDKRRVRGRTVIAVVFDEVAFWHSENSANPDEDVYRAVRPAMATIPNAMLIGISSPYARRGLLYKKWKQHFGKPGKVLVVQAPTWRMNPNLARDGAFLSEAFEDDPISAAAEFGAQFRSDIEGLLTLEALQGCIDHGVRERPPLADLAYYAFADPSGGSADSFTLAIAHKEGRNAILDATREIKPPFDPETAVDEMVAAIKSYGCKTVYGDRYGGEWVKAAFRKRGIGYISDQVPPKSKLFQDLVPVINSARARLLDSDRLIGQLVSLERRTGRGGDIIDHPPGGHDDIANAVAGAFRAMGFQDRHAKPEPKKPDWLLHGGFVDLTKITYDEYHRLTARPPGRKSERV